MSACAGAASAAAHAATARMDHSRSFMPRSSGGPWSRAIVRLHRVFRATQQSLRGAAARGCLVLRGRSVAVAVAATCLGSELAFVDLPARAHPRLLAGAVHPLQALREGPQEPDRDRQH